MASCEDGTPEIAALTATEGTNKTNEAKKDGNEVSAATEAKAEKIRRKMMRFKEEYGTIGLRRLLFTKMLDLQQVATVGDDGAASRWDAQIAVLREGCDKISVALNVSGMNVGVVDTIAVKLGLLSDEHAMLFNELAKSAADLCIQKMRSGASVTKLEKMKLLECEVDEAKRVKKELVEKLRAFQKNRRIHKASVKSTIREIRRESYLLQYVECIEGKWMAKKKPSRENELSRMPDYQIREILQLIDVGAAFLDATLTEISRDKLGIAYSDVEVRNIKYAKGSAFIKESSRVLMEMMKGVKCGERPVPVWNKAIALAGAWAVANIDLCLLKVCAGVVVELRSVYDVLKSEIAETQKMEAEVKDEIVMYQRNHATMASCKDGTPETAALAATERPKEINEAKKDENEVSAAGKAKAGETRRKLMRFKEEQGVIALRRLLVKKMLDLQEEATVGDAFLSRIKGIEAASRLNAQILSLREGCDKISVALYVSGMRVGVVDTLAVKLGLLSNEHAMLFNEYAKSAADLCIKKMHSGASVSKLEKMKILEFEVAEAKRVKKALVAKLRAFQKNTRAQIRKSGVKSTVRKIRREALNQYVELNVKPYAFLKSELSRMPNYQVQEILELVDVGAAFLDRKLTEITGDKLGISYSDLEVRNINYGKGSAFLKESLRVLMEMMKGVKCGERPVPVVNKAIALADAWAVANIDVCLLKVCAGVVVELRSVYDVLKSEIAETQKMEAEVKDEIVMYQWNHAQAWGVGTDLTMNFELDDVVEVEQRQEELIHKFGGSVWKTMGVCAAGAVVGIVAVNSLLKKVKKR